MTDVINIGPHSQRKGIYWGEIWRYRELLLVLIYRDIAVRYRQSALGALWVVLQPLGMMLVFSVIFGRWAHFSTWPIPYYLFTLSGLLPWTFFANSVTAAGNSVLNSQALVSKVYFPRLLIPISAIGAPFVDFLVSLLLLVLFMLFGGVPLIPSLLLVPLIGVIGALAATGVGCFISALSVRYRDFRHLLPFMVQTWMFLTPVIYPPVLVPEKYQWLLLFNPMSGVVGAMRSAAFGTPCDWSGLGTAAVLSAALFWSGARYFQGLERKFADEI